MQHVVVYYIKRNGSTSRELLYRAATAYTGADTADWVVEVTEWGKPFFPQHTKVCFSISHSGDYWSCAFSNGEVGFDLQEIRGNVRAEDIAKRFFAEGEKKRLEKSDFALRDFYTIWTAKESYGKFTGTGLTSAMGEHDTCGGLPGAVLTAVPCPEGYAASLCTGETCEVTTVTLKQHLPV